MEISKPNLVFAGFGALTAAASAKEAYENLVPGEEGERHYGNAARATLQIFLGSVLAVAAFKAKNNNLFSHITGKSQQRTPSLTGRG